MNLEIQNIVHNELKAKLIEWNADWGCAVVMETKTGEIKAICNLRRANRDGSDYTESDEYVLHKMVEPGSTFKIASALAYLEKRNGDDNKTYPILYHEIGLLNLFKIFIYSFKFCFIIFQRNYQIVLNDKMPMEPD